MDFGRKSNNMATGKSEQVKKRGNQKMDMLLQRRMSGTSLRLLRHSTKLKKKKKSTNNTSLFHL
jgi:hypothetical protein